MNTEKSFFARRSGGRVVLSRRRLCERTHRTVRRDAQTPDYSDARNDIGRNRDSAAKSAVGYRRSRRPRRRHAAADRRVRSFDRERSSFESKAAGKLRPLSFQLRQETDRRSPDSQALKKCVLRRPPIRRFGRPESWSLFRKALGKFSAASGDELDSERRVFGHFKIFRNIEETCRAECDR